jgi:cytochrome d ubiquinol oxidase subunit II
LWARLTIAQRPTFLRGLTIEQAAASHDTLVAVVVAVIAGGAILFPSLGLLFRLVLRGQLDYSSTAPAPIRPSSRALLSASASGLLTRSAIACLAAAIGFLTLAGAGWAHVIGVASILGFLVLGFLAVAPAALAADEGSGDAGSGGVPAA